MINIPQNLALIFFTAAAFCAVGAGAVLSFSDGTLDASFGESGKVTTAIGSSVDEANAVVVQPDNKIVVAGYSYNGTNNDFALARYNPDGSLDQSFDGDNGNGDGIVTTAVSANNSIVRAIAVQPDNKIVVAGTNFNGVDVDFAVARYNPDGTLDSNFGVATKTGRGTITTALAGSDIARAVAVQSDGKIVVAGNSGRAGNADVAVVRYNSDGTLDNSFGSGGVALTAVGAGNDFAFGAAIQPDGKIIVAGYYVASNADILIVRYNTDGSLDQSFDGDGIATTAIGTATDEALAVALQPDGKIVIAGCTNSGGGNDFALARFNPNGSLDATLTGDSGTANGKLATPIGAGLDIAFAVIIQTDGKIVSAGYSSNGTNFDFAVVRYNPNGTLDTSFDRDGKLTTRIGSTSAIARGAAIQPDGKIIVAGYAENATRDFAVVRYGSSVPTAAAVQVGGRAQTSSGAGVGNAYVTMIDQAGSQRLVKTNPFGYFRFANVQAGETYVFTIRAKRFSFALDSQVRFVNEEITNLQFVAE